MRKNQVRWWCSRCSSSKQQAHGTTYSWCDRDGQTVRLLMSILKNHFLLLCDLLSPARFARFQTPRRHNQKSKMATIMTPPSDGGPATATVGRSRRKRFSLAGLNLGSKATEKEASASTCHNSDKECDSAHREDTRIVTGTGRSNSSSSATSLLSRKTSAAAAAIGNSNISAATAVASRDPRARRGSLPIFDRISTTPKEEMGRDDGRVKEADDNTLGGGGSGFGSGGSGGSSATAAVASGIGAEVTANTDFERRGPPRRRHSASATQIEAISRQAFGGGDAAAYESDSSSDSSAWLDSDSDDED